MYIQRVAKTAKLMGTKGSIAQRGQFEDILHAKFSKRLEDTFESQGYVTKKQVKGFLKELGENISLKIKKAENPSMGNRFSFFKKIAKSKFLKLPFDNANRIYKNDYEKVGNVYHEGEHYITEIIEPKYVAYQGRVESLPSSLHSQQNEFYYTRLYGNESPTIFATVTPKNDFKSYKNEAASLKPDNANVAKSKNRKANIERVLSNFFLDNPTTREQRITLFQGWRHELKSEVKSFEKSIIAEIEHKYPFDELSERLKKGEQLNFREEFKFSERKTSYNSSKYKTLEKKASALKSFIEQTKLASELNIKKYYAFEQKINILEKELREVLQIQRMENIRRLKANTQNVKLN